MEMSRDFQQTHENSFGLCKKGIFWKIGLNVPSIREICKVRPCDKRGILTIISRTKRLCSAHLSNQWFRRYLRCIPILSSAF